MAENVISFGFIEVKSFMFKILFVCLVFLLNSVAAFAGAESKRSYLFKQSSFVSSGVNSIAGDKNPAFKLNEIEFAIDLKTAKNFWLRAELNYLGDFAFTEVNLIEQAFVEYHANSFLKIYLGKFNAGFGFEAHDQIDLHQKTHSLSYQYGIPKNLLGIKASFAITEFLSLALHISEGWPLHNHYYVEETKKTTSPFFASAPSDVSNNALLEEDVHKDVNNKKSFGGRLDFSPNNDFKMGLAFIYGPEKENNVDQNTFVLDFDSSFTGLDNFIFGLDISAGHEEHLDNAGKEYRKNWAAAYFTMHHSFSSKYSLSFRYQNFFDNKNGNLLNFVHFNKNELFEKGIVVHGISLAPTMELNKDSFIRLEISSFMADRDYLLGLDGKESKFQLEAYLEFVARFSTVRKKRTLESEELKSYEEVPSYDEAFE